MNRTDLHAAGQAAKSLLCAFLQSGKRHLILTGERGSGKTTLLQAVLREGMAAGYFTENFGETNLSNFPCVLPGFTTYAVREKSAPGSASSSHIYRTPPSSVHLLDRTTGKDGVIGLPSSGTMKPVTEGFLTVGMEAVEHALKSESAFVCLDEIGFLEESCPPFCDALLRLFDTKRVLAVVRDQPLAFLEELKNQEDVFVYRVAKHGLAANICQKDAAGTNILCECFSDTDTPELRIGAVVMASGESRRFGSNKLMADFFGKPLIQHVLETVAEASSDALNESLNDTLGNSLGISSGGSENASSNNFRYVSSDEYLRTCLNESTIDVSIAVTRSPEIYALCSAQNFPCLLHKQPHLNDTIRLGLEQLLNTSGRSDPEHPSLNDIGRSALEQPPFSDIDACLFLQSDQPLLTAQSIKALILAFRKNQHFIYRLSYHGRPGSPILFPRAFFPELLQLPKDCGGNYVMRRHPKLVRLVEAANDYELRDADTPEALEELKALQPFPTKRHCS